MIYYKYLSFYISFEIRYNCFYFCNKLDGNQKNKLKGSSKINKIKQMMNSLQRCDLSIIQLDYFVNQVSIKQ